MTTKFMSLAVVLVLAVASPITPQAQAPAQDVNDAVSLSVEVRISRYLGDESVSSRPYVLAVTAGVGESSLELEDQVPVPVGQANVGPDGVSRPVAFNYQSVGTQISCFARARGDGRFEVSVRVQESSVGGDDDRTTADAALVSYPAIFRSFDSDNTLVLRDGQTRQYVAAVDAVTGETIRVDVTLTVLD
ncbi:MAG: type II and III secretion system protein [Acidobacteria bacterium]|nr:type II and III secretion system protein [Acidobacteriota bacterium]MYK87684.1 type II and III secretion system protein [Acidobacteriota bacterium]